MSRVPIINPSYMLAVLSSRHAFFLRDTYLRYQLDRAPFDGGNRVEAVNGAVIEYVEGEEERQQGD